MSAATVPEVLRAQEGMQRIVVQFRRSSRFLTVESPSWVQEAAGSICPNAEARTGQLGTDTVVESVAIPKSEVDDVDEACELAGKIVARVES